MKAGLFLKTLVDAGFIDFWGVPDSCLKPFCDQLDGRQDVAHQILANEGAAVACAIGSWLATERQPVVYMQNSGLGNAVNPLTSLSSEWVFDLPLLLIVGWRGDHDGLLDEPQHRLQGQITEEILKLAGFEIAIICGKTDSSLLRSYLSQDGSMNRKLALLVKPDALVPENSGASLKQEIPGDCFNKGLLREDALRKLISCVSPDDIVICTTGKSSRELYELRLQSHPSQKVTSDLLVVGGMGHAISIALGVALNTSKKVICIDGDGAFLMHLGSSFSVGKLLPSNLIHVLINNRAHESVGGQPTGIEKLDLPKLTESFGYNAYLQIKDIGGFENFRNLMTLTISGPVLVEICVELGSRSNLTRPQQTPKDNAIAFADKIRNG